MDYVPDSTPEIPKEITAFPVTKEACERVISEIGDNADRVMMEEGTILASGNPELHFLIDTNIKANQANAPTLIEGALWTHRMLRAQAEMRGTGLPKISRDLSMTYLTDQLEELKQMQLTLPDSGPSALVTKQVEQMTIEEPELAKGLKELFKYRAGKSHLYVGVVSVYVPLSKAIRGRQLGKSLGL